MHGAELPNLEPPAPIRGTVREASPPTRVAVLRIGLRFKFLSGRGGGSAISLVGSRAARAASGCTQYTKRPGPLPIELIRSRPGLGLLHQSLQ